MTDNLAQITAERDALFRQLSDQTRHNIASRRSLCEQSDRYKAERDAARAAIVEHHCAGCTGLVE